MNYTESTQYAIEIPGRGYYDPWTGTIVRGAGDDYHGIDNLEDALKSLDSTRRKYESIGCADVGETARIVSRTVRLTFGPWLATGLDESP